MMGPGPTLERALVQVQSANQINAAVLDLNLYGEMIFHLVDTLEARGIPFVFTTSYDDMPIRLRYRLKLPLPQITQLCPRVSGCKT
jgi:CheY-like chemotaxis protein